MGCDVGSKGRQEAVIETDRRVLIKAMNDKINEKPYEQCREFRG